ncbi:hypothetical protein ACQUW4_000186 [Cronobacter dublinensis]
MRKKKIKVDEGVCKLTLMKGRFVDSHILPRALTSIGKKGERALQVQKDAPVLKRFQGWYDNMLCTSDGEEILSQIDNKAIKLLRKNYLVWSGWPTIADGIPCDPAQLRGEPGKTQVRTIERVNFLPLKVFFMSILWRAAASTREDMQEILLPDSLIEKLRLAVLKQDPLTTVDFPVFIYQHNTRGHLHNLTPIMESMVFDFPPPYENREYQFCRIYMDGLIAYIALDADETLIKNMGPLILGSQDTLLLIAIPFEESRSLSNLKAFLSGAKS